MPTAAAPENAMAKRRKLRVSAGLYEIKEGDGVVLRYASPLINRFELNVQVCFEALRAPIFNEEGEDDEDRDTQEVIVEHGVPVREAGTLNALAHREHICC
jgi:hypothetical protein